MKKTFLTGIILTLFVSVLFADNIQLFDMRTSLNPLEVSTTKNSNINNHSYRTNFRDPIDIKINGQDSTHITQGNDYIITIQFSAGYFSAQLSEWIDMDGNGQWDAAIDFDLHETEDIADNDANDEDPTVGIYQETMYGDEDGPNRVGNLGLLYIAEDGREIDVAYVFIESIISDYSVSGDVTPAVQGIIIDVRPDSGPAWMAFTDAAGYYICHVPEAANYDVQAMDHLGVTGGMIPQEPYPDVLIDGHLTGYDFHFVAPSSFIEGYVLDELGSPLIGYEVEAGQGEGPGFFSITNEFGFYSIGVAEGYYRVRLWEEELIPDYLSPKEIEIFVADGATETVDFTVYSTDSTIQGAVYLDGSPLSDVEVNCDCDLGYSFDFTEADGSYSLPVSSMADYNVSLWEDAPDWAYTNDNYHEVLSGSTGMDFNYYSTLSAIEGYVYDSFGHPTDDYAWINAENGINWYYAGADHNSGYFIVYLPNGTFDITGYSDGYISSTIENITLSDNVETVYFYLDEDSPTPITLSSFTAVYANGSSLLEWTTQSESNNLGWNLYRSETELENAVQINGHLINGAGTSTEPTNYKFYDEEELVVNNTYLYWLESISFSGETEHIGPISLTIPEEGENPDDPNMEVFGLFQNYPNPAGNITLISFNLKEAANCELNIYNAKGQLIRTFKKDNAVKDSFVWNGTNDNGEEVSPGIYFYRLEAGNETYIKKMILME